jgi:Fusaric acid resistance protein-like
MFDRLRIAGHEALRPALARAAGRVRDDRWVLLQQALAATVAWVLASYLVDSHQPFFAPIAAVVALNAPLGERGGNALRLLEGVVVGIICGDLARDILSRAPGTLFLATLAAVVVTRALGGTPLALAQAAAAAILTVAVGDPNVGPERLFDALIGGGVALVFSQVLFTPEPVSLLRRAEGHALTNIADAFEMTARALDEDDQNLANRAIDRLRYVPDGFELARARHASQRVAKRSAAWRSQRDPVVQENENAGQLDLLGASALMLIRHATPAMGDDREVLAPTMHACAAEIRALARDPGDRETRQRAVDELLKGTRDLRADDRVRDADPTSALAATVVMMRDVAVDTMIFAGVDPVEAASAIRRDDAALDVPTPAATPRTPFKDPRKMLKRTEKWVASRAPQVGGDGDRP